MSFKNGYMYRWWIKLKWCRISGGLFSSQSLLFSQILLSIIWEKSFSNDGKFFFQFEKPETLFSSFNLDNLYFVFFRTSFNLRSKNVYFLLSIHEIIICSLSICKAKIFIRFFQYLIFTHCYERAILVHLPQPQKD